MQLLNPAQIKDGKSTFEAVARHTQEISSLQTKVSTVENERIVKEKFTVNTAGQITFIVASLEGVTLSDKEPLRLNINGLVYYEPSFSLNIENKTLTWLATAENNGFDLDVTDIVTLEYCMIP